MMRLPLGVREQPAWIFIGFMVSLVGFGQTTGLLDSSVSQAVGHIGLKAWGATLMLSGVLVMVATVKGRPSLERLALRLLTCNLVTYLGWLLVVAPFQRAATTVILAVCLAVVCETRVWHLKGVIRQIQIIDHLRTRD